MMEFQLSYSHPKRWCCENAVLNMSANLENSAVATGLGKVSFHSNPNERQCQTYSSYRTIAFMSHASKVMLKILQAKLQQYMNRDIPDIPDRFRKGRGNRDQVANIYWIIKKERNSRKTCTSALLTMPKYLTVWIKMHYGKFLKRWE